MAAERIGIPQRLEAADIDITFDHISPGYGKIGPDCVDALSLMARTEGILLDPVYTGKALAGLIHDIRSGVLTSADSVVFIHTGGTPALFAYAAELATAIPARRFH